MDGLPAKIPEPGFMNYLNQFDICCLVETFTSENFDFSASFDDHVAMHSPGIKLSVHGRLSGGVVVLIKKALAKNARRLSTSVDNVVAFRLQTSNLKDTIILCTYIPPIESPYYHDREATSNWSLIEDLIITFQNKYPQAVLLLCGDMNARIGKWDLHLDEEENSIGRSNSFGATCACAALTNRQSQDDKVNKFGKILINMCKIHHIRILNGCSEGDRIGQYTYISTQGSSVIDYGLVVAQQLPYRIEFTVGSKVESDHMPLEIGIGSSIADTNVYESPTHTKVVWNQNKIEEYARHIQSNNFNHQLTKASSAIDISCDLAVSIFNQAIIQCAECMTIKVREKSASQSRSKWFDQECRTQKQKAMKALRHYRSGKEEKQKMNYLQQRALYKTLIREKKKKYNSEIRSALTNNARDSRTFWTIIRNAQYRKRCEANIHVDVWKQHFAKLLQTSKMHTNTIREERNVIRDEILDSPITTDEIRGAIHNLKASKAPGLDGIPGGCIKVACEKIVPFLSKLFNTMYDLHDFPKTWSYSVIVPIHKKGDTSVTDNYRGISLLCALSKVFTAILAKRLRIWIESKNKVCPEQAGFRTQYSTVDHIFTLHAMISRHVYGNGRGKLYVAFIDYQKAFDSVDRQKLWEILTIAGVSNKFLLMLKSMYNNIQSCVRWRHVLSDMFDCSAGVKQGALESPSIFNLYINVVAQYVRERGKHGVQIQSGFMEIFLLLFADDIALLSTTRVGLQTQINNLIDISKTLNLKVNLEKTKIMVFRKGGRLAKSEKWFLNGTRVEVVNKYKYLGFIFTTRLSMKSAIDEISTRGKQKCVHILKVLWNLQCMKPAVFTRLFDSQVQSSLLYSSEIWGHAKYPEMEKVHTFGCKRFLGLDPRTPNHMVYGDLGRFPLYINGCVRAIKYWLKLSTMKSDRLPKQAYIMLCVCPIPENRNWAAAIKQCLFKYGFGFVWLNGGVGNIKYFLGVFKRRLQDCYLQEWYSKNGSSERYEWYSSFKANFGLEDYLSFIDIRKFRNVLIRFRFGINDLKKNNRFRGGDNFLCPFCQQVEDEEHFLLTCFAYDNLRKKYLTRILGIRPSTRLCTSLMKNYDVKKYRLLAMYIYYAMEHRNGFIQSSLKNSSTLSIVNDYC